jgi:hypothetical protein
MSMDNLEAIVKKQIDQLSSVELTRDLIDRIDIARLAGKARDIVGALNDSSESLDELINKGSFKTFLGSFGKNDKVLANAEKAVVDSAKFNVGLSCLLVLFSKAIKKQQDEIVAQQVELQHHQERLEVQANDILKIQGLTKDQAVKIVQLLQADEYVKGRIEQAKAEIECELSSFRNEINLRFSQFGEIIDEKVTTVGEQTSQAIAMSKQEFEVMLAKVVEGAASQYNLVLSELGRVSERVSSARAEFAETIRTDNALLGKRTWWSLAFSSFWAVLLVLKILGVV